MKPHIALLTVLTDFVPAMLAFYRDVLGFKVKSNLGEYVELENEGVRFAICDREIMEKATDDDSYIYAPHGQSFELAFPCDTPEEVDEVYSRVVAAGAKPIKPPSTMPWGQRAAFFADPDGYIHELFSELKQP
jgi:lactoylglutathione lyase